MGFLRNFGIVIASVLLFVLLVLAGVFATLSTSITYENVQPKVYTVADQIITTQIGGQNLVNELTPYLALYCLNNTEIVQDFNGYTFVFPCSVIEQGYEGILNYSINYLVGDFYYKEYNCSFVKCFEESDVPLFLVSDFARQHWRSLFYKSFLGILILIAAIVLLVEKKSNSPLLVGSLLVGSSFVILQLERIGGAIARAVLSSVTLAITKENSKEIISQIVSIFFSNSGRIFMWMLITGLLLIALSIVWKLTGFGLKISKKIEDIKGKGKPNNNNNSVSKQDIKKVVKQEISKSKKMI